MRAARFSRILAVAALGASMLAGAGCFTTNKSAYHRSTTATGTTAAVAADGAKGQCVGLQSGSEERTACITCYSDVLHDDCSGASDPTGCSSDTYDSFTQLVNQCISEELANESSCGVSCAVGKLVNVNTCTCESTLGETATLAPRVTLQFPTTLNGTTLGTGLYEAPSCSVGFGGEKLKFSITNYDGKTASTLTYAVTPPATAVNEIATSWVTAAAPAVLSSTSASAALTVTSGGPFELAKAAAYTNAERTGQLGKAVRLSGYVVALASTVQSGDGAAFINAGWIKPYSVARDRYGNMYATDIGAHTVRVLCSYTALAPENYWCENKAGHVRSTGYIYTIAGTAGTAGQDYVASPTILSSPAGIAVDRLGNVYVADSGNHAVIVLCGGASVGAAGATDLCAMGNEGKIGTIIGTPTASGSNNTHLNTPLGVDAALNGAGPYTTNVYIADSGNKKIRAVCGYVVSDTCPATAATIADVAGTGNPWASTDAAAPAFAAANITYPVDLKVNWNGNIVFTDRNAHLIRAICRQSGQKDFCDASTPPSVIKLAGDGTYGDTGDGAQATAARVAWPQGIEIAKAVSDDVDPVTPFVTQHFRDQNIAFTELYDYGSGTQGRAGAVVRMICGDNTGVSSGFCAGQTKGTMIRLGGQAGVAGSKSYGDGGPAISSRFANPTGVAYDRFKNLVVASGVGALKAAPAVEADYSYDRSLVALNFELPSPSFGIAYKFTDTKSNSATYCLNLRIHTSCNFNSCSCRVQQASSNGFALIGATQAALADPCN